MLRLLIITAFMILSFNAFAAERVVILAPAAADIFVKLKLERFVVGVTRSVHEIPNAKRVGGHIKPNIELIKALKPDLIIIGSNRFFTKDMERMIDAEVHIYHPLTIFEIFTAIKEIGFLMESEAEAESLIDRLNQQMAKIHIIEDKKTVIYESVYMPYTVAGSKNIVADIIKTAGGKYLIKTPNKLVKYSVEKVIKFNPDLYIFQVGPMNKKPVHPQKRPEFKRMSSLFVEVDELSFSRANTISIYNAVQLNKVLVENFK